MIFKKKEKSNLSVQWSEIKDSIFLHQNFFLQENLRERSAANNMFLYLLHD